MKMNIQQVQTTCERFESQMDSLCVQMNHLMTMFQKQNGQSLPNNTKNNP